jgi:uncharacterized damage-inducible protein DinB
MGFERGAPARGRYHSVMTSTPRTEAWLSGPVDGVPPLLMPVAHALLHAQEDASHALRDLPTDQIWKDAGAASVGYHVRHLGGALDRLLTYARGEALSPEQRSALRTETLPGTPPAGAAALIRELEGTIARAMAQLKATPPDTLLEPRGVGRQQLPSTVLGLLFHAAEHAARHAGQAVTTARFIRAFVRGAGL